MTLAQLEEMIHTYRSGKTKCRFFDCNRWIVHSEQHMLHPMVGIQPHIQEMAKQLIEEAVVANAQCIEYNPSFGNEQLISLIEPYDHLYGSIVWSPELAYTASDIGNYLSRMVNHKTVSVRMFPKKLNYSLKKWQVGDVLETMERLRLPLMLWHMETSWDTINEICEQYKHLPVIVEGNDQKLLYHNRYFITLLKRHENLYIETHNLIQHEIMEHLVNKEKVDRLLFGTYAPYNDANSSMMMITDADICERSRKNIAGDHMRRLIQELAVT